MSLHVVPEALQHVDLASLYRLDGPTDTTYPALIAMAQARGFVHMFSAQWATRLRDLPVPERVLFSVLTDKSGTYLTESANKNAVGFLSINQSRGYSIVFGRDAAAAKALTDEYRGLAPAIKLYDDPSLVPIRFWTASPSGGRNYVRKIAAPEFTPENYNAATAATLGQMMSAEFQPGKGGQLMLWYGPPGTGKTYALRALAQAWRNWAQIDYVIDPEAFFGDATYLTNVLLSHELEATPGELIGEDEGEPDPRDGWRLLILEDTGELMSADARTRAGQGLSRLLNVVDGMIGQGLKTLVLITTNEDISKLHPAVSRPGRCAVQAKFEALDASRAVAWGKHHGLIVPNRSHSLAELFALRDGFTNEKPAERPIGFGFSTPPSSRTEKSA